VAVAVAAVVAVVEVDVRITYIITVSQQQRFSIHHNESVSN
jgi:hypothetical protein